jgi:hypothetical protein
MNFQKNIFKKDPKSLVEQFNYVFQRQNTLAFFLRIDYNEKRLIIMTISAAAELVMDGAMMTATRATSCRCIMTFFFVTLKQK